MTETTNLCVSFVCNESQYSIIKSRNIWKHEAVSVLGKPTHNLKKDLGLSGNIFVFVGLVGSFQIYCFYGHLSWYKLIYI